MGAAVEAQGGVRRNAEAAGAGAAGPKGEDAGVDVDRAAVVEGEAGIVDEELDATAALVGEGAAVDEGVGPTRVGVAVTRERATAVGREGAAVDQRAVQHRQVARRPGRRALVLQLPL